VTAFPQPRDGHESCPEQASFKLLIEAMPYAVFVHEGGVIRYANPAMAAILGFSAASELLGVQLTERVVHPGDREVLVAHHRRQGTGESIPLLAIRWVHRDGETVHVEGTSTPVVFDGRRATAVVVRNVTEQHRAHEAHEQVQRSLRLSEERYRALFEGSPVSIILFDAETLLILAVNEAALRLYGYERDELLRMKLTDLKTHEDEELRTEMMKARSGPREWLGTKKHRRKDGGGVDVEIVSHTVVLEGRRAVLSLATDVSARARVEEQHRQAQKMEALGRLSAGIAHDFNNILAVIVGEADFLRGALGEGHPLTAEVTEIEVAAQRGAALTWQMRAFSRHEPSEPTLLSLNACITDHGQRIARIIGADIEVRTLLEPEVGAIEADRGQVDELLLSVILNARDAMPHGGRLAIETRSVALEATEACALGMDAGPCVRLTVADTGVGMDPGTRARVFEPFFTTKEVGKGTGLGLATVFGIVKRARGGISVESEPGRGTTFRFFFPRAEPIGSATCAADAACSPSFS
jgi:PAS domain S-box-containing protein